MQTACLRRNLNPSRRALQYVCLASSSGVQWQARRSVFAPVEWFRSRVAPALRKSRESEPEPAPEPSSPPLADGEMVVVPDSGTTQKAAKAPKLEGPKRKYTEHKYSTSNFKISHRKLNMLGRQISGKPIDHAILQMMFSEKRASKRVKSMLILARDHALGYKGLDHSRLVVSEAWVTKGPKQIKRLEARGRGHFGIRVHPDSRIHVVLREGKTPEEQAKALRRKQLKRIVSAGLVREDVPIRNPSHKWAW